MNQSELYLRDIIGSSAGVVVLSVAIVLAALFIGLLIYDYVRGRRQRQRNRRFLGRSPGFRHRARRWFQVWREAAQLLREGARKRARHRHRAEKLAEHARRASK